MNDELRDLLAKQAITEVLADYVRGADRIDVPLLKSVFHEDAVADYGAMFQGSGHEFAEFLGAVHPTMETHHHQLGSITIRVDGDRAGSESYVTVRLRFRNPDGSLTDITSCGRYVDEWLRADGAWRISRRRYLHHLDESRSTDGGSYETLGARDGSDPSYEVLSLRDLSAP